MKKEPTLISPARIKRLKVQGYLSCTDREISEFSFGNKFAYILCSSVLLIGIITASIPILSIMMTIAFFGIVLPYHPFDYLYNNLLAVRMGKPRLPPRSKQLKFACTIATAWIGATIYLFYSGFIIAGYIAGGSIFSVALLVSATDICIPSIVYNFIFKIKV